MTYTIGEVSKKSGLSISTLRYYDEQGLFLYLKKDSKGNRIFDDNNMSALLLINCLKNSGLKIKEIKNFMMLCTQGNSSLKERYNFFINQEKRIKEEISKLEHSLDLIHYKQWYYEKAIEFNDEKKVIEINKQDIPNEIQELYEKTHLKNL